MFSGVGSRVSYPFLFSSIYVLRNGLGSDMNIASRRIVLAEILYNILLELFLLGMSYIF